MFIVNGFNPKQDYSQSFGSTLIKSHLICSESFVKYPCLGDFKFVRNKFGECIKILGLIKIADCFLDVFV